jgi:hypothetical protein
LKDSLILKSIDSKNNEERRSLEATEPIIDVKKVLVVRVAFRPTQSEEDLFDDIFDDDKNMVCFLSTFCCNIDIKSFLLANLAYS